MHVTKRIDLDLLERELAAAAVPVPNGLGHSGTDTDGELYTYAEGAVTDLPPQARPVVNAHTAPPRLVEYAGETDVHAIVRTTDAAPLEVFRFPTEPKHAYSASLTVTGIDAANGALKIMEGRFGWKRLLGGALTVGVTVVSDIHDAAATGWAPNYHVDGNDVVFTVQGAAGRTVDWLLVGSVAAYSPEGAL